MILAAALLVLVGLGLFVMGILTGTTALYWACVAACVVAAVLLIAVRRTLPASGQAAEERAEDRTAADEKGRADVTVAAARRSGQVDHPVEHAGVQHAVVEQAPPPEPRQPEVAPVASSGSTAIPPAEIPPVRSAADEPTGAHAADLEPAAHASALPAVPPEQGEPPLEEVEVTDLLLVLDLHDEVLVVDEHPRYHLSGCPHLRARTTIPLPIDEARTDGFTPCGTCTPDRRLADRVRAGRRVQGG